MSARSWRSRMLRPRITPLKDSLGNDTRSSSTSTRRKRSQCSTRERHNLVTSSRLSSRRGLRRSVRTSDAADRARTSQGRTRQGSAQCARDQALPGARHRTSHPPAQIARSGAVVPPSGASGVLSMLDRGVGAREVERFAALGTPAHQPGRRARLAAHFHDLTSPLADSDVTAAQQRPSLRRLPASPSPPSFLVVQLLVYAHRVSCARRFRPSTRPDSASNVGVRWVVIEA